ncbi:RTA1-domain-containing protein [Mycena indigotica]|uniref:RTA1-domain-containing protein n=1 Tax=Mycena indigotica TaxID=2126181 RepID=A0A8H6VR97_9AGAR|nr:RTA1-domain-containing protein [Mycena indigotica]KAF7291107.1 RTA1-domain-containing protein [Mycena indigotica]
MVQVKCMDPRTSENYNFMYCPSFPAAVFFTSLFGLSLIAHVIQAMHYRKAFCWVLIMGASWETAGFALRVMSVLNTTSIGFGIPSQLLILLAPLWINAFLYVVMARLIHFFIPEKRVARIRAQRLSLIFVLLDITAFLVQVVGGLMINPQNSLKMMQLGIHIYMGGIGIQQFFVILFTGLVIRYHVRMKQVDVGNTLGWKRSLYTMYSCIVLITIRIVFRLIEFSAGLFSPLTMHEAPFYATEALPMFLALLVWNISHPGVILQGPDSELPKKQKKSKKDKKASVSDEEKSLDHQQMLPLSSRAPSPPY